MNGKVIPFPVHTPVVSEPDVHWFISVGRTLGQHYSCKCRDGYWTVDVKASTLADAMALVELCSYKMGSQEVRA